MAKAYFSKDYSVRITGNIYVKAEEIKPRPPGPPSHVRVVWTYFSDPL